MASLCTWCIGTIILDVCHVSIDIKWPGDEWTPERHRFAASGPADKKIEVIEEALENGWPVYLNDWYVTKPLTTWHGDPICQAHLHEQMQRDQQPTTVRMAQWR